MQVADGGLRRALWRRHLKQMRYEIRKAPAFLVRPLLQALVKLPVESGADANRSATKQVKTRNGFLHGAAARDERTVNTVPTAYAQQQPVNVPHTAAGWRLYAPPVSSLRSRAWTRISSRSTRRSSDDGFGGAGGLPSKACAPRTNSSVTFEPSRAARSFRASSSSEGIRMLSGTLGTGHGVLR
jgi:hypothetical protein